MLHIPSYTVLRLKQTRKPHSPQVLSEQTRVVYTPCLLSDTKPEKPFHHPWVNKEEKQTLGKTRKIGQHFWRKISKVHTFINDFPQQT